MRINLYFSVFTLINKRINLMSLGSTWIRKPVTMNNLISEKILDQHVNRHIQISKLQVKLYLLGLYSMSHLWKHSAISICFLHSFLSVCGYFKTSTGSHSSLGKSFLLYPLKTDISNIFLYPSLLHSLCVYHPFIPMPQSLYVYTIFFFLA